ncbi:hypothetical protein [Methanogenium sp. MK-MG]|uniref:hypothetical protein n=1 Tax=Methanogenium sp. MK-MG TaxID=2599926 RepID=UPI0013EDFCD0|nr:hypothetical protein [Methanogenium sp. MK-MG]
MKNKDLNLICCAAAILILYMAVTPAAALTAQVIPPILPKGLPLSVSGQTDNPGEVAVWIIGLTCHDRLIINAPNGTFTEELFLPKTTSQFSSGQYFLIIEDTGPDGKFALETVTDDENTMVHYLGQPLFALDDAGTSYSDTAMALSEALDRPDIDDRSLMRIVLVEEPWVRFDQNPNGHPGDLLRFAGSTNLPPNYEIHYSILPSSVESSPNDSTLKSGRPFLSDSPLNTNLKCLLCEYFT